MKNSEKTGEENTAAPCMYAWHVNNRDEKSFWTKIGPVWEHGDKKGFTVDLDLLPAHGGRVVLRARKPDEASEPGRE